MANEFQAIGPPSGVTAAYVYLRNAAFQVWNGAAFVAYNEANWSTYGSIAATRQGTSRYFVGSMPGSIPAGLYYWDMYSRAGGAAAVSDVPFSVDNVLTYPPAAPATPPTAAAVALAVHTYDLSTIDWEALPDRIPLKAYRLIGINKVAPHPTIANRLQFFAEDDVTVAAELDLTRDENALPPAASVPV